MTTQLADYSIALVLTIVLEVIVAMVLGYRKPAEVTAVFWVNVFSHPLVNFLIGILGAWREAPVSTNEILLFEAGVVLVEWQLLCYALPRRAKMGLLALSLAMNVVSYCCP